MSEQPDFHVPGRDERDNSLPRFYLRPVQNNFRSEREGRPIFDDVEYVEIRFPGDRRTEVDRAVKADDKARWPAQYAAFKNQQEHVVQGLPLSEWAAVTRSQVEELKHFHVFTVEQVAGLTDDQLQNAIPMGGQALRERARRFMAQGEVAKPIEALAAEVRARDATIATQADQIASLQASVDELKRKRTKADVAGD